MKVHADGHPHACLADDNNRRSFLFGGRNINITKLGARIHRSTAFVSRVLTGKRGLHIETAMEMALALRMTTDTFNDAYMDCVDRAKKAEESHEIVEFTEVMAD